jgi:hypothetical protein
MYEIWLGMNIVHETLLTQLPLAGAWVVAVAVLMTLAILRARDRLAPAFLPALAVGAAALIAAFFFLPGLTQSSLGEMGYWVDWMVLGGLSLAVGALLALPVWPAFALWLKRN